MMESSRAETLVGHLPALAEPQLIESQPRRVNPLVDDLLRPLFHTSAKFYVVAGLLGTVVLCGGAAWAYQVWHGMGVVGKR